MKTQEIVEEPVGKPSNYSKSRYNAVKHGATSETVVLSSENRQDFNDLLTDVRDRIAPVDAVEDELVGQIVFSFWKIRRCRNGERVFIEKNSRLVNGVNKRDVDWGSVFSSGFMGNLNRYEKTALNQVRKLFEILTSYRNMQAAKVIDADVSDK
jgi:hypothetical protein